MDGSTLVAIGVIGFIVTFIGGLLILIHLDENAPDWAYKAYKVLCALFFALVVVGIIWWGIDYFHLNIPHH